jgi:ribosomal protein L11 methyltransferase
MAHIQLKIAANEYQQEELIALLSDFGPEGFEQKENELLAYFDAALPASTELQHLLEAYEHEWVTVEEKNWNEEWERNFQPVKIERFCAIRADFHEPVQEVDHEIVITPKMSFGTGHHATTYMMIAQMQHIGFTGKKVFDFGTGTGILAILAERLGAASVTAIDVDEWSIENAIENCERNHCSKISVSLSSEIPREQFELILANINRNVILQYAEELTAALRPGGLLLVSGILAADEEDITSAFTDKGFELSNKSERENWISMLFNKR